MTSTQPPRVNGSPDRPPWPGRSTSPTVTRPARSGSCGAHWVRDSREPWTRTRCAGTHRGCHDGAVTHLISTTALAHEIEDVVVIDVRWTLTSGPARNPGRDDYVAGHVP